MKRTYTVILEKGPNSWGASVPDLPGCVAAAETKQEVIDLITEAVPLHLEALKESRRRIPPARHFAEAVAVAV